MVNAVESAAFLDTVSGELAFFKGVAHARPAGAHRFFHVLTIRNTIKAETGKDVAIEDLWTKLGKYYDLETFDANELDPRDVEPGSLNPDVANPSLNSSTSDDSDPESETPAEPPRKKQRPNFNKESSLSSIPPSPDKDGMEVDEAEGSNGRAGASTSDSHSKKGGKAVNLNFHPHFRCEFQLPYSEFYPLMHERRVNPDPSEAASSIARSPEPSELPSRQPKKGRPSKKEKAVESERGTPAAAEDADDDAKGTPSSPARSPKAGRPGKHRSRTRSISNAKGKAPNFGGNDSDSSLSEPEERHEEEKGADEDEEVAESVSRASPMETDEEAPSVQGRGNTRSKRKEREPTVESIASVTRAATSKRQSAASTSKSKKPTKKKKK